MSGKIRYIFPLILFSFLISCKSFDNKLLNQKAYFDNSILPMKVVINRGSVEKLYKTNSFITCDEISGILRQNLMFESNSKNIYLSVIIRKSQFYRYEHFYEMLFLMVPVLFGAPMGSGVCTVTLEAAVIRNNGKILKTYTSTASDTEYFGGTGNYPLDESATYPLDIAYGDGYKMSHVKALQSACKDLREQLKKDEENIKQLTQ